MSLSGVCVRFLFQNYICYRMLPFSSCPKAPFRVGFTRSKRLNFLSWWFFQAIAEQRRKEVEDQEREKSRLKVEKEQRAKKRRKQHVMLSKRTKGGQPVMKHTMQHLLEKIQSQTWYNREAKRERSGVWIRKLSHMQRIASLTNFLFPGLAGAAEAEWMYFQGAQCYREKCNPRFVVFRFLASVPTPNPCTSILIVDTTIVNVLALAIALYKVTSKCRSSIWTQNNQVDTLYADFSTL